jgi:hypothetical protein
MRFLLWSLDRGRKTQALADGLAAFVSLYYDNYTDAKEIEHNTLRMLRSLVEESGVGIDVDLLIYETETRINQEGGVTSDSDGASHQFRTPVDIEEDQR